MSVRVSGYLTVSADFFPFKTACASDTVSKSSVDGLISILKGRDVPSTAVAR